MLNKVNLIGSGNKGDPYRINTGSVRNLKHQYENEKLSISGIAELLHWPKSRVRKILISIGITLRSPAEGIRLCPNLGQHLIGKKRPPFSIEHRKRIAEARRNYSARGISLKPNGYVEYTRGPHKGRGVHRVLLEQRLGRRLSRNEIAHHEDGIRSHNIDSNIKYMTRVDHARYHAFKNLDRRRRDEHGRFC